MEISRRLNCSPAVVSSTTNKLCSEGLLTREKDVNNRGEGYINGWVYRVTEKEKK
jgi:predicted transcriptional regulator